jgi:hypothetical protein
MKVYRGRSRWERRYKAIQKVHKAAQALDSAMCSAEALIDPSGSRSLWMISNSWKDVAVALGPMCEGLDLWLNASHIKPEQRRRGRPHPGRRLLRILVFGALDDAGVQIPGTREGCVADVLAAVGREADRLTGKKPKKRKEFDFKDWRVWLAEYESVEQARLRTGPPRILIDD